MQKTWFNKVLLTLKSTWLCIKYPFLYPRNRWTGLHYNNWTMIGWHKQLYAKYHVFQKLGIIETRYPYYYKSTDKFEDYWTNWWAKPLIAIIDWIHDNPIQWLHCLTDYTELDALPETWKKDFGLDWARDTKKYLKQHNIKHYRIAQLKEKWGEFDWLYPPDYREAAEIEHKYVERSKQICIHCGKTATMVTPLIPWKNYYCSKCAPKYAYPISRVSIALNKKEIETLKKELSNIDDDLIITQDDFKSDIIVEHNSTELNLSN